MGNGLGVINEENGEQGDLYAERCHLNRAMRRHSCHPEQLRQATPVTLRSLHPPIIPGKWMPQSAYYTA